MLAPSLKKAFEAWLRQRGQRSVDYRCQPLPGGLTNRNWKITLTDQSLVLRQLSPASSRLGVDRAREARVVDQVATAGIAPRQLWFSAALGVSVSQFIAGNRWQALSLADNGARRRLLVALARLHLAPVADAELDLADQARHYLTQLPAQLPLRSRFEDHMQQVFARLAAEAVPHVLCHHDLNPLNILDNGDRVWLIDWEYAANGDPLFDLAGLLRSHAADAGLAERLLKAWLTLTGYPLSLAEARRRLALQGQVCDWLAWLWGQVKCQGTTGADAAVTTWIREAERSLLAASAGRR